MQQTTLDFTRAEQLSMIREAQLPKTIVPADRLKSMLKGIDCHGRECWCSQATLAEETNLNIRTARRALDGLRQLGLITSERQSSGGKATVNRHRIVWSQLALFCPSRNPRMVPVESSHEADQVATGGHLIPADQVAKMNDQVAKWDDQVAKWDDQVATGGHRSVLKRIETTLNVDAVAVFLNEEDEEEEPSIRASLREAGIAAAEHERLARLVERRGISPQDFSVICGEFVEGRERGQLNGVGALVWRLQNGGWPVSGLGGQEVPGVSRAVELERLEQRFDSVRYDIIRAGRAAGANEDEIDRRVAAARKHIFAGFSGEEVGCV